MFGGKVVENSLGEIIFSNAHDWVEGTVRGIEIGKSWFQFLGISFETAANVAEFVEKGPSERRQFLTYNTYFALRISKFPWNNILYTTFAVGEGVSYAKKIPNIEKEKRAAEGRHSHQFLNYLVFEVTAGLPFFQNIQGVFRIHHRSGAYDLYKNVTGGSNALIWGLKILY